MREIKRILRGLMWMSIGTAAFAAVVTPCALLSAYCPRVFFWGVVTTTVLLAARMIGGLVS